MVLPHIVLSKDADLRTGPDRWSCIPRLHSKSADDILAATQRFCQRTQQIGETTESGH
jgi:hypothetical protein